jgi:hypothetical protein
MKESDQLATSFITPFGMFCYVTMPFGLWNAGATYQRCMQHVFGDHIGRTVEAYVFLKTLLCFMSLAPQMQL